MFLDMEGVRNGDQYHLMQPNSTYWFIWTIVWEWKKYYITVIYILIFILIQGLYKGVTRACYKISDGGIQLNLCVRLDHKGQLEELLLPFK